MAKKGQSKKGIPPLELSFKYMGEQYTMSATQAGLFFGVGYGKISTALHAGIPHQDIADEAAVRGGHKPRADVLFKKFSRRGLLA